MGVFLAAGFGLARSGDHGRQEQIHRRGPASCARSTRETEACSVPFPQQVSTHSKMPNRVARLEDGCPMQGLPTRFSPFLRHFEFDSLAVVYSTESLFDCLQSRGLFWLRSLRILGRTIAITHCIK